MPSLWHHSRRLRPRWAYILCHIFVAPVGLLSSGCCLTGGGPSYKVRVSNGTGHSAVGAYLIATALQGTHDVEWPTTTHPQARGSSRPHPWLDDTSSTSLIHQHRPQYSS